MQVTFAIENRRIRLKPKVHDAIYEGMQDITTDLARVSAASAPRKTGKLEQSVTDRVTRTSNGATGEVTFSARSTSGYNYAYKMHEATYQLGSESKKKRHVTSRFYSGYSIVGRDYLEKAARKSEQGYKQYLNEKVQQAHRRSGLF